MCHWSSAAVMPGQTHKTPVFPTKSAIRSSISASV
jgi:hypothetical protein